MVREGGTVREQLVNSFPRTYFQVTVLIWQSQTGAGRDGRLRLLPEIPRFIEYQSDWYGVVSSRVQKSTHV